MNDRFKFRGITKGKVNKFIYGSLLWYAGEPQIWDKDGKNYIVKPETVGQCTGLKDKNGKLIYGKDIIRFYFDNDEIIAVIEWDNDECRFYLNTTDYFKDKYVTDYEIVKQEEYEVIGNIYENKSLLESEG